MAGLMKNDPYNFHRTTGYIRRVISEEYNSVMRAYNLKYDPFFGWVVGNVVEDEIKTFVVENFQNETTQHLSAGKDHFNYLELSLLMQAIRELMSGSKKQNISKPKDPVQESDYLPNDPVLFELDHWKSIRNRFEELKEQEKHLFEPRMNDVFSASVIQPADTGISPDKITEGKYAAQKKRQDHLEARTKTESDPVYTTPAERIKKTGAEYHDEINYDANPGESFQINRIEKIRGKEIIYLDSYKEFLTEEVTKLTNLTQFSGILKIKRLDRGASTNFGFHLVYLIPERKNLARQSLEDTIQTEIDQFLSSRYLRVTTSLKEMTAQGSLFYVLEAMFYLDVVKVSETEDLFFVKNDDQYVQC
jgi:hypothetical protein